MIPTIKLKVFHYSGGDSFEPVDHVSSVLMNHCLNEDNTSINYHGLQKLKTIATAHNWNVEIV